MGAIWVRVSEEQSNLHKQFVIKNGIAAFGLLIWVKLRLPVANCGLVKKSETNLLTKYLDIKKSQLNKVLKLGCEGGLLIKEPLGYRFCDVFASKES